MYLQNNPVLGDNRHKATEQFRRLQGQAIRSKLWSSVTGKRRQLQNLYEVEKTIGVRTRTHAGLQLVPIDQIQGSEGRCEDFDTEFRPLRGHTLERWVGVAVAHSNDVALPAVDLVQLNDTYFVRDGHHRISVAKLNGQLEIEANVTVWRAKGANGQNN
jgi:hypothetical protein